MALSPEAPIYPGDNQITGTVGALSQANRGSLVATLTQRGGSQLRGDVGELAQYADQALRSHGYRAVVGLGSDRIGLFRGEAFPAIRCRSIRRRCRPPPQARCWGPSSIGIPPARWRCRHERTRASPVPAPRRRSAPRGDPARDVSGALDATYQLHKRWSASAYARVDRAYYIGDPRIDTTYVGSTRLQYSISRSADATLSYTVVKVNSNAPGGSYVDDIASLGAL
ncbi:MAG: outer membrane beta-barrel protein [Pseudomonadota bacterium]|nr:outer membrane beta-barrel protein [Pseudomonadota bacterium]